MLIASSLLSITMVSAAQTGPGEAPPMEVTAPFRMNRGNIMDNAMHKWIALADKSLPPWALTLENVGCFRGHYIWT
jgi:hypothetical protein